MEIKQTVINAQKIISLAEKEGWSEEELAKTIRLLHSITNRDEFHLDEILINKIESSLNEKIKSF